MGILDARALRKSFLASSESVRKEKLVRWADWTWQPAHLSGRSLETCHHCAARAAKSTASASVTADDVVDVAAENSLPSASKGLPPPLWPPELGLDVLLAVAIDQVEGMLGASKICDVVELAVSLCFPVFVLEVELVDSGMLLVSMTILVGTSVELAVNVLLTMFVVVCCVEDGVEEGCCDVVDCAAELDSDCKTLAALVHTDCGPSPPKK